MRRRKPESDTATLDRLDDVIKAAERLLPQLREAVKQEDEDADDEDAR